MDLPSEGWLDVASDPMGRWFAVVEGRWNKITKRPESRLIVRDGSNGKQLAQWDVESEIRSLTPSKDGNTLYARTSGKVDEKNLQTTRITWTYSGGGKVMRFDLAPTLKGIVPLPATPWATETCLIEDETPQARDIKADKRERKLLFEVPLAIDSHRHPRNDNGTDIICLDDDQMSYDKTWGVSDNGDIWVDRGSTIEQINVRDGKVLRTLPTPRSATVCSHPIYESQQFLSWRGDTITLRPFTDASSLENRKVLVKKPGWSALTVDWRGDRFGVKWVNKSDYSALAVLYDRATGKVLKEVQGQGGSNSATFSGEQDEGSEPVDIFEYNESEKKRADDTLAALPTYIWGPSYMHSVRATMQDPKSKQRRTVLWDGLRPDVSATPGPNIHFGVVSSLGGSLGAWTQWDSVTLYDAATRQQLARLPVPDVQRLQWQAAERTVLLESLSFVPKEVRKDNRYEYARTLRAFRVD